MDINECLSVLRNKKCLPERELRLVCEQVKEILLEESNIHSVNSPVNICGDIHGQYYDVLEIFNQGGQIPDSSYIFIGDFVDRGYLRINISLALGTTQLKHLNT